ncbi:MAG: DsbC family protein [Ectothiorhodospiraceae bacterium]|nr:DsbC family protein [Ectothiorhodospiraceae bacterium]
MNRLQSALVAIALAVAGTAVAAAGEYDELRERLGQRLAELGVNAEIQQIRESPVPGLYLVNLGGQIIFVSEDARYVVQGDMLDLQTRRMVSDDLNADVRRERLQEHGIENMIVYPAQGDTRHVVTVFTDIDCPYCRQMHERIDEYTALGIEVRYVQMPRAGVGSQSYQKAVAVWCADDRKGAMERAKSGASVEPVECENPVQEQLALARELGVNATPTFVTDTGRVQRGLVTPEQLKQLLEQD